MEIIAHRRNTGALLAATEAGHGVEMDLRSWGDRLIVQHDPFVDGEDFGDWLEGYRHGTLILNVKEEGLEDRILEMLKHRGVERFFFLDQSFPFLMRTVRRGESRCAIRVSEYESVETALSLAGLARWIWVDCFTRMPLSATDARRLTEAGFSLCFVSPELQGRPAETAIAPFRAEVESLGVEVAAVCTKAPALWS